jgi:ankyrin repeat protein
MNPFELARNLSSIIGHYPDPIKIKELVEEAKLLPDYHNGLFVTNDRYFGTLFEFLIVERLSKNLIAAIDSRQDNILLLEKLVTQPGIEIGFKVLLHALGKGNIRIVEILINAGANINQDIEAVLKSAIASNNINLFYKVFELIPVFSPIILGSGLISAVHANNIQMVTILIQKGADINYDDAHALYESLDMELRDITQILIANGANVNNARVIEHLYVSHDEDLIKLFIKNGANLHIDNEKFLSRAASEGEMEIVELLINDGANVNIPNLNNPLLENIRGPNLNMNIINRLIQAGVNVNIMNGQALIEAVKLANVELVSRLIEAGANAQLQDNSALKIASRNNYIQIMGILRGAGAVFNLPLNVPPPPPPPPARGLVRLPAGVGLRAEDAPPPQIQPNLGLRRMDALPNNPAGVGIRIAGGYYEKYLKYKQKYLALKKQNSFVQSK